MNGHAGNQIHGFVNTLQQNPTAYVLNEMATQHNGIINHVSRLLDDNFRTFHERFSGLYDMIHKQHLAQNVEQRRIVNDLSEMRTRTEALSTTLNSLSGQMQQLESNQDAVSTGIKRLNGGMGQLDQRLSALNEQTRQIDLNVQEIAELVKDPRAFGVFPSALLSLSILISWCSLQQSLSSRDNQPSTFASRSCVIPILRSITTTPCRR